VEFCSFEFFRIRLLRQVFIESLSQQPKTMTTIDLNTPPTPILDEHTPKMLPGFHSSPGSVCLEKIQFYRFCGSNALQRMRERTRHTRSDWLVNYNFAYFLIRGLGEDEKNEWHSFFREKAQTDTIIIPGTTWRSEQCEKESFFGELRWIENNRINSAEEEIPKMKEIKRWFSTFRNIKTTSDLEFAVPFYAHS
jgi:hypothetical protein